LVVQKKPGQWKIVGEEPRVIELLPFIQSGHSTKYCSAIEILLKALLLA